MVIILLFKVKTPVTGQGSIKFNARIFFLLPVYFSNPLACFCSTTAGLRGAHKGGNLERKEKEKLLL